MRTISFTFAALALVLSSTPPSFCGEGPREDKDRAAVAELLGKLQKPVELRVQDITAEGALAQLAKRSGVEIRITDKKKGEAHAYPVSMAVKDVRALDVLAAICDMARLDYTFGPTYVNAHCEPGPVVMRIYDVSDLTTSDRDLVLPDLDEGDAGRSRIGPVNPRAAPSLTYNADIICSRIKPESWDPALGTSLEERGGDLVIVQTEEVHDLIRELLSEFRASQHRQVLIEFRALAVKSGDLDAIIRGIVKRGGAWPEFDEEALAALAKLEQEGAAKLVFDGSGMAYTCQRVVVQNSIAHEYLGNYEISGNSLGPVVKRYLVGTIGDVRPILSDDSSHVTLMLRFTCNFDAGPPETALVQHAGLVNAHAGATKLTVKRTQPAQPQGQPAAGGAKPVEEDITSEFTITSEGKGETAAAPGPYQLQLPALGMSRIRETILLRAGRYTALSAPMAGKDGLVLGQELLVLTRCTPKKPAISPPRRLFRYQNALSDGLKAELAKPVSVNFLNMEFSKAAAALMAQLKAPFIFDAKSLGPDGEGNVVTLELKEVSGSEAMEKLAKAGRAGFAPYSSLLLITKPEAAKTRSFSLRIYDVRDLTAELVAFPGPVTLFGEDLPAIRDIFLSPQCYSAADFATILKDKLFPADFADPATSIEESCGKLVIMQTEQGHAKVAKALDDFRKTLIRRVSVTARWAVVSAADLKTARGPEFPGILDAAQTQKVLALLGQPGARDVSTARALCFSRQRVHVLGGIQRAIVKDYDVQGEILVPVVASVLDGALLDVTPIVGSGEEAKDAPFGIILHFGASLSFQDRPSEKFDPIASSPAADKDPKPVPANIRSLPPSPGKIHTPIVHSQPIAGTICVPNGGAALYRLPVPAWIPGENAEAAAKGERILILLIQAQELIYQ